MSNNRDISTVAILGAGVMGAQIAAHLTNAGIRTVLFDLPSEKNGQNAIVERSIQDLTTLKPNPMGLSGLEREIIAANYHTDLEKLKLCDLIIEAIVEKIDYKLNLYQKIIPYIHENAIFATNTSGLSINELGNNLPKTLQQRFCGLHFFNPPRYMKLVELIPHDQTKKEVLDRLETFLVTNVGKGVVRAKDTPNFIGNRIGVFSMLSAIYHAQELGLAPDLVDGLTGTVIGRPKSATFRTMDIVGLDTMKHVVHTQKQALTEDPWSAHFMLPTWIDALIERGQLGQKTKAGIYKKEGNDILVYDWHDNHYRKANTKIDSTVLSMLSERNAAHRFESLAESKHPQAQFIIKISQDLFHYCAYHLEAIAHETSAIDLAMRWGYGWQQGPFETWQQLGWHDVVVRLNQAIKAQQTMSDAPLPQWAQEVTFQGAYKEGKSYRVQDQSYHHRHKLPVYKRQYFPDALLTETFLEGETIFENEYARLWCYQDRTPIFSFKTKRNCVSFEVLEALMEAIKRAEKDYDALILWQRQGSEFSVGANLKQVSEGVAHHRWAQLENGVRLFQQAALALRYAKVPTIAAIQGLALGGGCELAMHTTRIVAAFETYIGLVEVGVGILPAGGGSKELALRAARQTEPKHLLDKIQQYYSQIIQAQISNSALDARRLNYLQATDWVVMNEKEVLFSAIKQAQALADLSYRPPLSQKFNVVGKSGIANLNNYLINLKEGDFITDHEYLMATKIAEVICGGPVESGSLVDEQWILDLEIEAIMSLLQTKNTQQRIRYMLENGKPLRN